MRKGIEDICECHDARVDWDSLALELRGVAFAVPPFVVVAGDFFGDPHLRVRTPGQELSSDLCMSCDEVALSFPESCGAQQNAVGHCYFADIVKSSGKLQCQSLSWAPREGFGK